MTRHRSGFWVVAFAFFVVMASATLPSPLYGLYRERDGLSAFTITLLTGFAVGMAAGTAIAYLIEFRLRADPNAPPGPARTIGTSVSVGALGVGPLVAGSSRRGQAIHLRFPISFGSHWGWSR